MDCAHFGGFGCMFPNCFPEKCTVSHSTSGVRAIDHLSPCLPAPCIILKTFARVKVKAVYVITNGIQWFFIFSAFPEFYLFPLFLFLWGFGELFIQVSVRVTHSLNSWGAGGLCFRLRLQNTTHTFHRHLAGDPFLCFQMWFVFKPLQTSSVVYVSVTSKPAWQKQKPSDQWVDMIDYVLCVSSGVLGVVYTETLAP